MTPAPNWSAIRPTRSSISSANSETISVIGVSPDRPCRPCSKAWAAPRKASVSRGTSRLRGRRGRSPPAIILKAKHGTRIAVVEAVECPTLLMNGYGEHNIQGIGDKHVPLIHNVMNTDVVIGVSDRASDGLNAVLGTEIGRAYLMRRLGATPELLGAFAHLGLSSLANIVGAIKLARHDRLGPNDVVVTVATDGAALYRSEFDLYLKKRHNSGAVTSEMAAEIVGQHLLGADTDHVLEATGRERERIFNLGYFTWVEQQGVRWPTLTGESRSRSGPGLHDKVAGVGRDDHGVQPGYGPQLRRFLLAG